MGTNKYTDKCIFEYSLSMEVQTLSVMLPYILILMLIDFKIGWLILLQDSGGVLIGYQPYWVHVFR